MQDVRQPSARKDSAIRPPVLAIMGALLLLAGIAALVSLTHKKQATQVRTGPKPAQSAVSLQDKNPAESGNIAPVATNALAHTAQPPQIPEQHLVKTNVDISLLAAQLNDPNPAVVKAAIKKLAAANSPAAAAALARVLNDPQRDARTRMDATAALGEMSDPSAMQELSQAAQSIQDPDIVTDVLDAIGTRDFTETQNFFQNYLRSPTVSSELRVAAVEALARAQGNPTDFLMTLLNDPDSDVRVSAAWALSATESTGNAGVQLVSLLQAEQDPDVRLRIYQALENQESFDVNAVINALRGETDVENRIAALDALAKALRDQPTSDLQSFFNQNAIAELKQLALTGDMSVERMKSVIALARANTPEAIAALTEIAQQSNDPKIKTAAGNAASLGKRAS